MSEYQGVGPGVRVVRRTSIKLALGGIGGALLGGQRVFSAEPGLGRIRTVAQDAAKPIPMTKCPCALAGYMGTYYYYYYCSCIGTSNYDNCSGGTSSTYYPVLGCGAPAGCIPSRGGGGGSGPTPQLPPIPTKSPVIASPAAVANAPINPIDSIGDTLVHEFEQGKDIAMLGLAARLDPQAPAYYGPGLLYFDIRDFKVVGQAYLFRCVLAYVPVAASPKGGYWLGVGQELNVLAPANSTQVAKIRAGSINQKSAVIETNLFGTLSYYHVLSTTAF